jgi:hypothetical protein
MIHKDEKSPSRRSDSVQSKSALPLDFTMTDMTAFHLQRELKVRGQEKRCLLQIMIFPCGSPWVC